MTSRYPTLLVESQTEHRPAGSGTGRAPNFRTAPELEHGRIWTAAIEAVWRDDDMPQPFDLGGLKLLRRLGIDLNNNATSYTMTIEVVADDLAAACRAAFGDWRLLTELAGLPRWDAISITSRELRI